MALIVSDNILRSTTGEGLARARSLLNTYARDGESRIDTEKLTAADLEELNQAAIDADDGKLVKAIAGVISAKEGDFSKAVPNFQAFEGMLRAYLLDGMIDGWLYSRKRDGKLYAEVITHIHYDSDNRNKPPQPKVTVKTQYYGIGSGSSEGDGMGTRTTSYVFSPGEVSRRKLSAILEGADLFKETPELKAAYIAEQERHAKVTRDAFAQQFRFSGESLRGGGRWDSTGKGSKSKVVHDLAPADYKAVQMFSDSCLSDEALETPIHPIVRVFDLETHLFQWVHGDLLTPYVYDKTLGEKLVLPATHRDLLDILTTDMDMFTGDFVEGKAAGNIILSKGIPGVGKTLAAEVYAELIEKPLYKIHSGNLGTTPDNIDKNLKEIFKRAKRWDCVLLLDEADVFVLERGESIEQNAIVAVFLRVLEYFDGLLFMTTNRADEIDEAIISRCIAIIHFDPPTPEDAKRLWKLMARNFNTTLDDALADELVALMPNIVGRDIKMLYRLVLRAASFKNLDITVDLFRQYAMFRAIKMAKSQKED